MNSDVDNTIVMVVDDTPANLQLMQTFLQTLGYEVRAFPKGSLALPAAEKSPPDVVLLDVAMPEMDGREVCRRIRESEKLRSVPVIFLSASDDAADRAQCFRAGGDDYIAKPFEIDELKVRLQHHLERSRSVRDLAELRARQRQILDAVRETPDGVDVQRIVEILEGRSTLGEG